MIKINKQSNYLAKVVKLPPLTKHPNADKLQLAIIDFQTVITGMDAKEGDIYIYFPLECTINKEFLSYTNSFSDKELNVDKEQTGFFNKHGRVRAVTLRGTPSQGYIIPEKVLIEWLQTKFGNTHFNTLKGSEGLEFDSYNEVIICEKYVPKTQYKTSSREPKSRTPKISRLVDNQFKLHTDTDNLRKNIHKLELNDVIGIHYKKHGTSFVVGNVLTNKTLSWWEKILKRLGVSIQDKVYDIIYSSRNVVMNEYETKNTPHYYSQDIWGIVKDEIKDRIPKGVTVYGEILGYQPDGGAIQKMNGKAYDYGCKEGEHKTYIYRITFTNEDGISYEFTDKQIEEFCEKYGFLYQDTFYWYGCLNEYLYFNNIPNNDNWRKSFIKHLEEKYNEKDCYMCVNKLPEEGIVVRKENLFNYEAYKLKSFSFLLGETKNLDNNILDIESEN
jgi:hypothetical protein